MNLSNLDIRTIIVNNGLKYKDVAKEMNISPEWLSRLLRNTLTPSDKDRIMNAIERIKNPKEVETSQTPAIPYKIGYRWHCGNCSTAVGGFWNFCQKCGTRIFWEGLSEKRKDV